jgi:hypothetical protein
MSADAQRYYEVTAFIATQGRESKQLLRDIDERLKAFVATLPPPTRAQRVRAALRRWLRTAWRWQ